ncbi:flagellar hook capping FlgD N-terminal domain-containing protein [Jonesiaceae bacterium BS-20]|uniref:Flagellar hook capping FlgD N-terminal domain-containing protein n=1 Tax=Jonesiaceae bacterium BS-20 TaxID=3120821 RepID=A0AAU7DXY6_9MICO
MPLDVNAVSGAGLYTNSGGVPEAKKEMDSETFMKLLLAQLRFQDPSTPMSTNEMMAQTTQLATMEQLTNIATTVTEGFALAMRDTAANLVGKTVTYQLADGEFVTGQVQSVRYDGAVPSVNVDGTDIPLDAVLAVLGAAPSTTPDEEAPHPDDPDATDPAPDNSLPENPEADAA